MDIASLKNKLQSFFDKYKYVLLVVLIGLVLMAVPERSSDAQEEPETLPAQAQEEHSINEKLEELLSAVEGAGKVKVLVTVAAGEETIYQTDESTSNSENTNSIQTDTITVTDAQRDQKGLIRQVNPPSYLGAIIVCQGADSPAVRLAVVDAVSKVTGLGADRISVIKMK